MRAIRGRFVAFAAAAAMAIGCNAILGNDVHELDPDAMGAGTSGGAAGSVGSTSTMGTSGSTMTSSTSTTSSTTSSTSTTSATTMSGSSGAGGTSGGSGAGGSGAVTVDASTTDVSDDGSNQGDVVDGADAAPACVSRTADCRGSTVVQCVAGEWIDVTRCPYVCSAGMCTGICAPGTMQCVGNAPETCDATGNWQIGATCTNACVDGACTGSCKPNTTQSCGSATTCNAGAMQSCDATGTWGPCAPVPSTCVSVPADWQSVAVTTTTCPDGFGAPQTYYTSATGGDFTCSCNCSGTQHCAGSVTLNQFGGDGGATCDGTPTTRVLAVSPACQSANFGNILTGNSYTISAVTYAPLPACTATPTPTVQPAIAAPSVMVCTPALSCPSGACLSPSQANSLCVSHLGSQTCPQDYPTRTIMASTYDDTRSCGACACGSTLTCDLDGVLLDNDSACSTGHPYEMTGTTSCTAAPSSYPLNAVQAVDTTTGNGACAMTGASSPTGGVALHDAATITVCCK